MAESSSSTSSSSSIPDNMKSHKLKVKSDNKSIRIEEKVRTTMKNDRVSVDIEANNTFDSSTVRKSIPGKQTEVEQIAEQIESRRANRIQIPFYVRKQLLHDCRKIALREGYDKVRISLADLVAYREKVAKKAEYALNNPINNMKLALGFFVPSVALLEVLDRAVDIVERHREPNVKEEDCWFHYQDFTFYHTRDVAAWPFWRTELRAATVIIFAYYLFTPILFCRMLGENQICVSNGNSYDGWMSSLYFASTTLSTVGYGDLSVQQDPRSRSFVGIMYMIFSMIVAVVAFSAAAATAFSPIENIFINKCIDYFVGELNEDDFLYKRVRRVKFVRLFSIAVEFFLLNLLGVFVSRAFTNSSDIEEQEWTWMTSLYWAVQTTTTIGYGDLDMPFNMRWFQIFYLTISTYFIGSCLGQLGSLKSEIQDLRIQHAWRRQRVTKRFINEMQAYDHDDKVDQFEFVVASLIQLQKVSSDDINPIMEKYQELAGRKGYISTEDDTSDVDLRESFADPDHAEDNAGFFAS